MTTVFHQGELVIQTESGVEERTHKFGNKLIRDHIIGQHKEFYEKLSYVFVALHDQSGQPWVSLIQGEPGFINSPDNKTLNLSGSVIGAEELGLQSNQGNYIGIVGLDFSNRRRNRLNGSLKAASNAHFLSIDVEHSFGNCPKYIQQRNHQPITINDADQPRNKLIIEKLDIFSDDDINTMTQADTLFIASSEKPDGNLDVNHRGGKPGFVRVEDDNQLWFNDYPGNNFFQTFGNIHNHPNVGLLFLDFKSGDLLLISGQARLEKSDLADNNKKNKTKFLPRRFYFNLDRGLRIKEGVYGRWTQEEISPFLEDLID